MLIMSLLSDWSSLTTGTCASPIRLGCSHLPTQRGFSRSVRGVSGPIQLQPSSCAMLLTLVRTWWSLGMYSTVAHPESLFNSGSSGVSVAIIHFLGSRFSKQILPTRTVRGRLLPRNSASSHGVNALVCSLIHSTNIHEVTMTPELRLSLGPQRRRSHG